MALKDAPASEAPRELRAGPFGPPRLTDPRTGDLPARRAAQPDGAPPPEVVVVPPLRPVPPEGAAPPLQTERAAGALGLPGGKPAEPPPNAFSRLPWGHLPLTAAWNGDPPVQAGPPCPGPAAPQAGPTPRPDPIETLREEVKTQERGSPEGLSAYVRLVQALTRPGTPNPPEYNGLAQVIEGLRTKAPPISPEQFRRSYQASVKAAAQLGILPAMVWLADHEAGPEAFDLFLRAARRGDSYAMMKVGRGYFKKGTPADDQAGFEWLKRAYAAPNPNLEAGAYLGDCYFSGRGTERDVQKAETLVFPLADQAVVPAMVLAGRLLQDKAEAKRAEAGRSTGPLKQKCLAEADALYGQARPWWERAAERGDWNAAAHLGQLYEKGFGGVEKSEAKAEALYQQGIKHRNALSAYFYGLLISEKPGRLSEAAGWVGQAAAAGIPSAKEWLSAHETRFFEAVAPEERP
jgi:TPR repeat protein